jgi:hypothetical protein
MSRLDISEKLIHFTGRKDNLEDAYYRLKNILSEGLIRGGKGTIKGEYPCVCFTEAPPHFLTEGLVNLHNYGRYAKFGVIFEKNTIFKKGGRPVIYQLDSEFDLLPKSLQWRHVRYEPDKNPPIDFTWEREWRIYCKELKLLPYEAAAIVPNKLWADRLIAEHVHGQDYKIETYSLVIDKLIAELYRANFSWRIFLLES